MARKVIEVRIGPEGKRDAGKLYVVTEMSALQAERWAFRAIQALARSGVDVPVDLEDPDNANIAQLAVFGFKALSGVAPDEADWLMGEIMKCVTYVPDPKQPAIKRGGDMQAMFEDDIEELSTRLLLRMRAFELSTGFSMAAAKSKFAEALAKSQALSAP